MKWQDNLKQSLGKKKKKATLDIFKEFLDDNCCLNQYLFNMKSCHGEDYDMKKLLDLCIARQADIRHMISQAFFWDEVPETFSFWAKLDLKWHKLFDNGFLHT